ncbi:flagellar hook-basal body complex protein [Thiovibrio frasassiensis]|uniref:Flagellar hook protein FlgE n=1 Tax=Thiovibrio frasassiensis TaxID=2984131 RepID=A0A9X4MQP5_9BACT|nr:flagellar hook-basal body complex protein [Thiovibrio frasassiensis]MDG4477017.1 flagellar hook-basal body complex protein [Thiovibrio frasassiensis]
MGVSSSLYASISGLSTMGNAMSVLGDNVSNVNTIAFKSSRATFQDVLSQSVATAAGAAQVGRGVTMTTIDGIFAQGSFESTSTATDLAIGGQGFFMLRAAGSAEADMYTRAGEFRFDKEGFLVNPTGNFVQGWTLDTTSGERQGTIGDINIGKTTPPVATTSIQVIANVDSRKNNEATELRLYDAWNGTNPSLPVPVSPIDANAYEYTTAIKVYDSVGASHDLTVYFDRTTKDNQWEYLVTCEPSEDQRVLSTGRDAAGALDGTNDEASIYTPDSAYNFLNHKGAGALQYGVIDFSTSGAISNISAWNVPPDGAVDPAQDTNRLFLGNTEQYYMFEANFTGAATNQQVALNLGARYSGQATEVQQILVTDGAAYSSAGQSTPITKETLWNTVYDSAGTLVTAPANVTFGGYNHVGAVVAPTVYALTAGGKVQDLLDAMDTAFGCTCTIDAAGKIKMTDDTGGPSGMAVTRFDFSAGVNPFGDTSLIANTFNVATSKRQAVSPARAVTSSGGTTPITSSTPLTSVWDTKGVPSALVVGDVITFTGTRGDSTPVVAAFTAGTSFGSPLTAPNNPPTMQDLLSFLEEQFDAEASVDAAGRLVLTDRRADDVAAAGYQSVLTITDVSTPASGTRPFSVLATDDFTSVLSDTTNEDGSRVGGTESINFSTEALSTTQYANSSTTIFQDQNGFAAGFLQSVSVDTGGVITGNYSNGQVLERAQVALASFNNLAGLRKEGGNVFRETTASGAPITGPPETNGLGSISPNSLEQSNVDLGAEFVKLITTQRGFQANSKIITTTDEMLADLINIKR